jgi:uncharacterized protein YbaR (Trm112 family)
MGIMGKDEIMRIVKCPEDKTSYEVLNANNIRMMRGEFIWMCTGWCRENSLEYKVLEHRNPTA